MNQRLTSVCLSIVVLLVLPAFAWGGHAPNVTIEVGVEGDTVVLNPVGTDNVNPNLFDYTGSMNANPNWELSWDMTIDPDPMVSGVFGLTNLTGVTKTFILSVSIPIAPAVTPSSLIGGSVGLTVTDSNGDSIGTVASATPSPVYNGLIDGAGVLPLLTDPFSLTVPFAGGTAVTTTSAGLPGPTIPGPAALATIGILHKFTLTPGDSIGLTSFFIVEPIPEPSSLALGAFGILASVATARRRRS